MTAILGRTFSGPITASEIELWQIPSNVREVGFITEEFQALCPVTGQPDVYSLRIEYTGTMTFESKGLKHYLWGFRDRAISAEDVAAQVADELSMALGTGVTVFLVQNVRGGLQLSVEASGVSR